MLVTNLVMLFVYVGLKDCGIGAVNVGDKIMKDIAFRPLVWLSSLA
jgi:hypothetical protein